MMIRTGHDMVDQWRGHFVSKAMPFTIPRLISGPDFFPGEREKPDAEDGLPLRPTMSPTAFLNAFARRSESQCRADWTALPIFRSLWYNFMAYTGHGISAKVPGQSRAGARIEVTEHIRAMQHLAVALEKGTVGKGVCKMPVGGDLSRLPFAEGLTDFERSLARAVCFRAQHMPGTLMVRKLMGHCATGARICHGESLFATWSPNEQHSSIVLRLMHNREEDPLLRDSLHASDAAREVHAALRRVSSMKEPNMSTQWSRQMRNAASGHESMCCQEEIPYQRQERHSARSSVRNTA